MYQIIRKHLSILGGLQWQSTLTAPKSLTQRQFRYLRGADRYHLATHMLQESARELLTTKTLRNAGKGLVPRMPTWIP
jgi:hypothetical protein